jgi:hypothetical protein
VYSFLVFSQKLISGMLLKPIFSPVQEISISFSSFVLSMCDANVLSAKVLPVQSLPLDMGGKYSVNVTHSPIREALILAFVH